MKPLFNITAAASLILLLSTANHVHADEEKDSMTANSSYALGVVQGLEQAKAHQYGIRFSTEVFTEMYNAVYARVKDCRSMKCRMVEGEAVVIWSLTQKPSALNQMGR